MRRCAVARWKPRLCLVIIAITDGDIPRALWRARRAYQQVTVRLAEIDAPEKAQPSMTAAASTWPRSASARLPTSARRPDRYGRTVARVECEGGRQRRAGAPAWPGPIPATTDPSIAQLEQQACAEARRAMGRSIPIPPLGNGATADLPFVGELAALRGSITNVLTT